MISLLTLIFSFLIPTQQVKNVESPNEDKIVWAKLSHDFGNITEGTKAKYTFTFTNNSSEPVEIKSANASCGCTVPSYSKEPVLPTKQGSVTAIFDSAGKSGNQTKNVTVETSVGTYYLTISCNIVKKVEKPKSPVRLGDN